MPKQTTHRRASAAVAALLFATTAVAVGDLAAPPAAAAGFSVTSSQTRPLPGEVVKLTGTLGPAGRPIELQKASGSTWRTVARAKSGSGRAFAFSVKATSTQAKYRVLGPKAKVGGKSQSAKTSNTVTLKAVKGVATLTFVTAPVGQSQSGTVNLTPGSATFTPARPGAPVAVERLVSGKWTAVASGKQDATGRFHFLVLPGTRTAPNTYRARSTPKSTTAITSPSTKSTTWTMAWADEFNGSALSANWSIRRAGYGGNRVCATTSLDRSTVSGGSVNLSVLPATEPLLPDAQCPYGRYFNGMVGTQLTKAFTHGVFAARIRFQSEQGMHGSIWMQHGGLLLGKTPSGGNDVGGLLATDTPTDTLTAPLGPVPVEPAPTEPAPEEPADPTPPAETPAEPEDDPPAEVPVEPPPADSGLGGTWGSPGTDYLRPAAARVPKCTPLPPVQYGDPANTGAEIDIVEYFGDGYPSGGIMNNVYWTGKDTDGAATLNGCGAMAPEVDDILGPKHSPSDTFHVYSVEWSPTGYVFRIDGFETFRTTQGVSAQPEYLILSLLTSDWELPRLRKDRPALMSVDWVRVWQQ